MITAIKKMILVVFILLAGFMMVIPQALAANEDGEGKIPITEIVFQSSNENPTLCRTGDLIKLDFKVGDNTVVSEVMIGDQVVEIENNDGNFHAEYIVTQDIRLQKIGFQITYEVNGQVGEVRSEEDQGIQYIEPLVIERVSFKSNNANSTVAANDNVVTFSFDLNHDIVNPGKVKIGDKEYSLEKREENGKITYQCMHRVENGQFEDQKAIPVDFSQIKQVHDIAGNEAELTLSDSVLYYAPLVISEMTWQSDNNDPQAAINGNTLTFSFFTNHTLSSTPKIKIADTELNLEISNTDHGFQYSGKYQLKDEPFEDNTLIPLDLSLLSGICDIAGNTALVETTQTITFHTGLLITDVHFQSSHVNHDMAINGDTVTFSFLSNRALAQSEHVKIGNHRLELQSETTNAGVLYKAAYTIKADEFADQKEIHLDIAALMLVKDAYGNTASVLNQEKITYFAPIEISDVSFKSNQADTQAAINGNTVTFSFRSNHKLIELPLIKINNCDVTLEENKDDGHVVYNGSYQIEGGLPDAQVVPLDISTLKVVKDAANQEAMVNCDDQILYYAPFSQENIVSFDFECTGNRIDNVYYIKNGDQITVNFTANRALQTPKLTIGGQTIRMESENQREWRGSYTANHLQDNSEISSSLLVSDIYGNPEYALPGDWMGHCTYYAPIQLSGMSFVSDNANDHTICKDGDTLTFSFTANHQTAIKTCRVGGKEMMMQSSDGISYTGSIQVDGSMTQDQNVIGLLMTVGDKSNNPEVSLTQEEMPSILYFAPISVNEIAFVSNNARDGSKYVKDGDTVTLTMRANHEVRITGSIGGIDTLAAADGLNYIAQEKISGYRDQQPVTIDFSVTDRAGNMPVLVTNESVPTQLQYFAPINAEAAITSNNAKNAMYAKAGDTITANITANHEVSATEAQIHGFSSGGSAPGNSIQLSTTLEGGSQGKIGAKFSLDDVAGNTLSIEKQTDIIYDDIAPAIKIDPVVSGFMNKNIGIRCSIEDVNLDLSASSMKVNDENKLSDSLNNGVVQTAFELKEDGTYHLAGAAEDMAGNRAEQTGGTVVIDQTKPQILTVDIDLDKQPAYQSGVIMSRYFSIKDDYLDTVNCLLTHKTGLQKTINWNLEDQINNEGEKAMALSATDKAQNQSEEMNYGFFVDGTQPKALVTELTTNTPLSERRSTDLSNGAKLSIELDKIWIGNEKPDHFTKLELHNTDTGEKINLLEGQDEIYKTVYQLHGTGSYELVVAAADEVGNRLDEVSYKMIVKDQQVAAVAPQSLISPLWFAGVFCGILLGIPLALLLIKKIKKGDKNGSKNQE